MTGFPRRCIQAAAAVAVITIAGLWWTGNAAGPEPKNNIGLETIPLVIRNQASGRGDLYAYLAGTTDPGQSGQRWYYLSDTRGNVTRVPPSVEPRSFAINLGTAATAQMMLPKLSGMRLYLSYRKPLLVATNDAGIPAAPAGWIKDDINFDTMFDWVELTWNTDPAGVTTLGGNVTQVDMFALPIALQMQGLASDLKTPLSVESGFTADGVRAKVLSDIERAGEPWSGLVLKTDDGVPTRVISPYHGMENGTFPKDQLDAYIDEVFARYRDTTLTASAEGVAFEGSTRSGDLVFAPVNGQGEAIRFPRPTTYMVYTSGPVPAETGGKPGVIQAFLQGAFLRSTLLTDSSLDACRTEQFYESQPLNIYAKTMHAYSDRGLAYAFGFDDTCSQSSFISVKNPDSITVTVRSF